MATKNCPKCDSPNPVACKKCACGHVFFTTRRSANAIAVESNEDLSEPTTPQEPELPRRRTARVTRERPQFYDALQVENQTRRQRELQKRRKASKSDEAEATVEDVPEKASAVASGTKRRAESPPAKAVEPTPKKRRGRPPGLTSRRSGRAQILASKPTDASKSMEAHDGNNDADLESVAGMHDVPPLKALQMTMVLSDINSRIGSSSVKVDTSAVAEEAPADTAEEEKAPSEDNEPAKEVDEKAKGKRKGRKEASPKVKQEPAKSSSPPKVKQELNSDEEDINLPKESKEAAPSIEPAGSPKTKQEDISSDEEKEKPKEIESSDPKKMEVDEEEKKVDTNSTPTNSDREAEAKPEEKPIVKEAEKKEEALAPAAEEEGTGSQAVSSTSKGCAFPC